MFLICTSLSGVRPDCCIVSGPSVDVDLDYGYIGARNDTTQQSGRTTDKEAEKQNITVYVSGCSETDTTGMLSPSTDGEYFKLCKILREFPGKFREYYRMNIKILIIFWIV
jgi:hypothetical protein